MPTPAVGKVYIGTTKRSVLTRVGGHSRCRRLKLTEKSGVAEHALSNGDYRILLEQTKLLSSVSGYFPRLRMESVRIQKPAAIAVNRRGKSLSSQRILELAIADL